MRFLDKSVYGLWYSRDRSSLLVFWCFFFKTKEKHSKEMLKNNLQQHNIYETKFKSLRINFITDTSLSYMIFLWNF